MPFTAHDPRVFYDAIVAQLATSTGKNIGEAQAPTNVTTPYAVVYPLDEDAIESTIDDPHDLTVFEWQVTSVGDTADQVMWMQQKVRAALLGWQPVVTGLEPSHVMRDGGQSVRRDDAAQPPTFFTADIFVCLAD